MLKTFVIAFVVSATMIGTSWAFEQEPAPSRPNPNPAPEQRDEIAKLTRSVPSFGRDRGTTILPPNQTTPATGRFRQIVEEANKRAEETREKILALPHPGAKGEVVCDDWRVLQVPNASVVNHARHRHSILGTDEARC